MKPIGRGQTIGATNPVLVFYAQDNTGRASATDPGGGTLFDLHELKFQIFDLSTEAKQLAPVQVYPTTPGQKQTVDTAGADRLGVGRYAASWACSATEPIGLHEVRWSWKLFADSPVVEVSQQFEVVSLPGTFAGPFYCALADMRLEGVTKESASDERILLAIQRASRYIERITGRFFEPRYLALKLDGHGNSALLLNMPLIAIESLQMSLTYLHPETYSIESTLYRAYNRHLSGLFQPDDRNNPRIELYHPGEVEVRRRPFEFSQLVFPRGQRNVGLIGVFGYTDADGTPFGQTPDLIRRACQLLVMRELPTLAGSACGEARDDTIKRHRLTSEKTRDQSYTLEPNHLKGAFTGDADVDTLLAMFVRPPMLGAA
jgi:hypothetical protein